MDNNMDDNGDEKMRGMLEEEYQKATQASNEILERELKNEKAKTKRLEAEAERAAKKIERFIKALGRDVDDKKKPVTVSAACPTENILVEQSLIPE
jgi:hypothetical protein